MAARRSRLKNPFDVIKMLENKEAEFTIDPEEMEDGESPFDFDKPSQRTRPPKNFRFESDSDNENDDGDGKSEYSESDSMFSEDNLKNVYFNGHLSDVTNSSFDDVVALMDDLIPDGGVKKKLIRPGNGIVVPPDAKVLIHYTVLSEGCDEFIESTFNRRHPKSKFFDLSKQEILPVFQIGIVTMEVGEISKFVATPEYGYGKHGVLTGQSGGYLVPKDTRILVCIHIDDIITSNSDRFKKKSFFDMSQEELEEIPFEEQMIEAEEFKAEAAKRFSIDDFKGALKKYKKAVIIAESKPSFKAEEEQAINEFVCKVYSNIGQCYINLEKYKKAVNNLSKALDVPNIKCKHIICKTHFRYADAILRTLSSNAVELAEKHLAEAIKLKPFDNQIRVLQARIKAVKREEREAEAENARKMLGTLGLP